MPEDPGSRAGPGGSALPSIRRWLLVGVLAGLLPAVAAAGEIVLPAEICRGLWIVPLTLESAPDDPLHLVLDTGAEPTSIDRRALERVLGRQIETGKVLKLKHARIGSFEIDKLRAGAFDLAHLGRALGREVDGILGFPVFRDVLLTLDYREETIRIRDGVLARPDGRRIFRDVGGKRPRIGTAVGGRNEKLLIDSGSTGGFDLEPDERLEWIVKPRPVNAAVRFSGVEVDQAGRLAGSLTLGPLVFTEPVVERTDGTSLVGYEVMRYFTWTFDQRKKRIEMQPTVSGSVRLPGVRGLGVAFDPLPEGFEVIRVFSGSPAAEVGLEEGDLVTHLDGRKIGERGCVSLNDPTKDRLRLVVERDGVPREVEIEVSTLVP